MLLRREAGALANVCSRVEQARFGATTCIHLTLQADGVIRMEATDGRRLLVVRHGNLDGVGGVPVGVPLFIPANTWKQVFKLGAKSSGRGSHPELANIHLELLEEVEEQATPNPDGSEPTLQKVVVRTMVFSDVKGLESVRVPVNPEVGRFPDVSRVIPTIPPRARFLVDPRILAQLLTAVADFGSGEERRVEILFYGANKPVGVMASFESGLVVDGLVVPLGPPEEPRRPAPADPEPEVEVQIEPPPVTESEYEPPYEPDDEPPASAQEPEPESPVRPRGKRKARAKTKEETKGRPQDH